jgi:ATP-dependent DNA helicase DinG
MLTDATKDAIRAAYARLKEGLPGFRPRAAQGRMIAEVAKALATAGGAAVVEGTIESKTQVSGCSVFAKDWT